MEDLTNKSILLLVPNGKGIYGTGIMTELQRRGAKVFVFDERPSRSTISKAILRLAKGQMEEYLKFYFRRIIDSTKGIVFDYVLVIRGEALTPSICTMFRKAFNKAYFILYLWDSLFHTNTKPVFPYFDRILSFDMIDVQNNIGLIHRPLFFLPDYRQISSHISQPIDLVFIGTVHGDRYTIIKYFERFCREKGLSTFFYLYFPSRLLFLMRKLSSLEFRHMRMNDFKYRMMPASQAASILSQSKVSLDVEDNGQKGLTMRTIESIGARIKLITTNKIIREYDFFNEQNIFIIDRDNPIIDLSFIQSPYSPIDPAIYESYSLEGWIDDVFNYK